MYWISIWLTNQNHGLHKSNIVNDRRWIFYIYRRISLTKENKWFGCVSVVFRRFSMSFLPIDMSFFYKRIGAYFSTKCFYLKKKVTVKHFFILSTNLFHPHIFYTRIRLLNFFHQHVNLHTLNKYFKTFYWNFNSS